MADFRRDISTEKTTRTVPILCSNVFAKIAEELAGPPLESILHRTPTKYGRSPEVATEGFRAGGGASSFRRSIFFLFAPLLKYPLSQISSKSKVGIDGCTSAPSTETTDALVQAKVATRYTVASGSLVGKPSTWSQSSLMYTTHYVFSEIS